MSFKVKISDAEYKTLASKLSKCFVFTLGSIEDVDRFFSVLNLSALFGHQFSDALNFDFPPRTEVELVSVSLDSVLLEIVDTILKYGIEARLASFDALEPSTKLAHFRFQDHVDNHLSSASHLKDHIADILKFPPNPHTQLQRSLHNENLRLKERFTTLKVDCSKGAVEPGSRTVGSYDSRNNRLSVYPFALFQTALSLKNKDAKSTHEVPSIAFIAKITILTIFHEFVHLLEPCILEDNYSLFYEDVAMDPNTLHTLAHMQALKGDPSFMNYLQSATTIDAEIVDRYLGGQLKRNRQFLFTIAGHCLRFKLTLLELTQKMGHGLTIKPNLLRAIKKQLKDEEVFEADMDALQGRAQRHPLTLKSSAKLSDAERYAYEWETQTLLDLELVGFVFASKVEKTANVYSSLRRLRDGVRPNYAKGSPLRLLEARLDSENVMYSLEGCSNLMAMAFEGDAFGLLTEVVLGQEYLEVPEDSELMQEVGLYVMGDSEGIFIVYSNGRGMLQEMNLEEAWWILTL